MSQSIHQSINQSINQTLNKSINQSINQSIKRSINKSINQSINRLIDRSIEWTINQTINRSTKRSNEPWCLGEKWSKTRSYRAPPPPAEKHWDIISDVTKTNQIYRVPWFFRHTEKYKAALALMRHVNHSSTTCPWFSRLTAVKSPPIIIIQTKAHKSAYITTQKDCPAASHSAGHKMTAVLDESHPDKRIPITINLHIAIQTYRHRHILYIQKSVSIPYTKMCCCARAHFPPSKWRVKWRGGGGGKNLTAKFRKILPPAVWSGIKIPKISGVCVCVCLRVPPPPPRYATRKRRRKRHGESLPSNGSQEIPMRQYKIKQSINQSNSEQLAINFQPFSNGGEKKARPSRLVTASHATNKIWSDWAVMWYSVHRVMNSRRAQCAFAQLW